LNYKIIDNFLEEEKFNNLSNFIKGTDIPWFVNEDDVENNTKNKNGFFRHVFYHRYESKSNWITKINPIMEKLNPISLISIRANLNVRDIDSVESSYHIDNKSFLAHTAIFFLNDCNSKTFLKLPNKEIIVGSKENRMLIFKSSIYHKVIYATDIHKRYVINFNYIQD
tara:strand:- start:6133 stop:6636 length:504 start_codon:yes stop_codon:yes gene_type:complete